MQKPISIKEDIYYQLKDMKTDSIRSFSEIIKFLMDENKILKEENAKFEEWKKEIQKMQ